MSNLVERISNKCRKMFNKRIVTEVSICIKDSKTGEILHSYPIHRLYNGDKMEISAPKFAAIGDIKWS